MAEHDDRSPSLATLSARTQPPWRLRARLWFTQRRDQFLTAAGLRRGFFVKYPYADKVGPVDTPYPEVEAACAASAWRDVVADIAGWRDTFAAFGADPRDPELANPWFPPLDGMAAYALVRKFRPRRILEIGSGNSTYVLARAVQDNGIGRVTCIDPAPRREIDGLGVDLVRRMMTPADADRASELEADDILFIDSSHILLPGTDVDIQLNRLLPRLAPGVLVHVHDIFLPDDYPAHWREFRYAEQNALIGWILGGAFEIVWPGFYVLSRHQAEVQAAVGGASPLRSAGSFWLRRR